MNPDHMPRNAVRNEETEAPEWDGGGCRRLGVSVSTSAIALHGVR